MPVSSRRCRGAGHAESMHKFMETEPSLLSGADGEVESQGNGVLLFKGDRVSIWKGEKVLEVDGGEASQCECT